MKHYLITFHVDEYFLQYLKTKEPCTDTRSELKQLIASLSPFSSTQSSYTPTNYTWLLCTELSPKEITNKITSVIGTDISFFVIEVVANYDGNLDERWFNAFRSVMSD